MNERFLQRGALEPPQWVDILLPDESDSVQPVSDPATLHQGWIRALILVIATCLSTFCVGVFNVPSTYSLPEALKRGFLYAAALMIILICHEMGHFLQSIYNKVHASWPYFLPVPIPPIGTMGAVIVMEPRLGHRRALFDIGISGPLAGLVPTLIFCIVGIHLSQIAPIPTTHLEPIQRVQLPLLFNWLFDIFGAGVPDGYERVLHPIAYAGWVGMFITSLNLIPIGQLDGGHILYTLLRKKAHYVSGFLFLASVAAVIRFGLWGWSIMLILVLIMGPEHPPTADDDEPLGWFRYILGWATLAFVLIGFTPQPFTLK